MKILILTSSQDTLSWKSLPKKLAAIKQLLNSGKNANFNIEIQYTPAIPIVDQDSKRLNSKWLDDLIQPFYKQGYDIVGYHFNHKQYVAWGVLPTLGGSNPRIDNPAESLYWWADEDSERHHKVKFVETFCHEVCHGYFQKTGLKDVTHEVDAKEHTVTNLLKTLDWSLYPSKEKAQKKEINRLQGILATLKAILASKPAKTIQPSSLLPLVARQADKFVKEMDMLGLPIRITEGYRSIERQNELYAQGRTTKGNIVTQAKGGESLHNYGVAIDIVFRRLGYDASNDQWLAAATVGERLGFEWGGNWNEFVDKPHFQIMKGYTLKDFQNNLVDYNKFN